MLLVIAAIIFIIGLTIMIVRITKHPEFWGMVGECSASDESIYPIIADVCYISSVICVLVHVFTNI
jgi:hypothetical protein